MNSKALPKFILQFTVFVFLLGAIAAYPIIKLLDTSLYAALGQSILFFFLLTLLMMSLIIYRNQKGTDILKGYLLSVGIKMLIALIYFVVMLKSFGGSELGFTLCFFSSYLVCTFFEVYFLMTNLRQNSETSRDANK